MTKIGYYSQNVIPFLIACETMERLSIKEFSLAFMLLFLIMTVVISVVFSIFVLNKNHGLKNDLADFEYLNNASLNIYTKLVEDMGYVHAIHNFKNYIIRGDEKYHDRALTNIESINSKIEDLRVNIHTIAEKEALDTIESTFDAYKKGLKVYHDLMKQGYSTQEIDQRVTVDDEPAFKALSYLSLQFRHSGVGDSSKVYYLSEIIRLWGYGGFIHHFKNFLLRKENNDHDAARKDLESIKQNISIYRSYPLNNKELNALDKIEKTVVDYENKLQLLKGLQTQDLSIIELDQRVKVVDVDAKLALDELYRQFLQETNEARIAFYSELDDTHQNSINIMMTGIFLLVALSLLALILFFKFFYRPIVKITAAMSLIARHELDTSIPYVENKSEIGQMANALVVFRDNIVALVKAKEEVLESAEKLKRSNEELEAAYESMANDLAASQQHRQNLVQKLSANSLRTSDIVQRNNDLVVQVTQLNQENENLIVYMENQMETIQEIKASSVKE